MTHNLVDIDVDLRALTVFQRECISCAVCGHFLADAPATRPFGRGQLMACAPACPTDEPTEPRDSWPATKAEAALLVTLIAAIALAVLGMASGPRAVTGPGPCRAAACSPPSDPTT
ncbi:hypothetical protein E1265_34335 [Streptomyces sp. 8K308]|uniref:hypothetical protein n=1 Tax=Streptomyces sp. 8K308 TaxID=2530388 RepID=UPI0010489773|nr:hypothetical protein [Streptomyces sp. 8K308]TDC07037.1 hypothetical protein E1265_34335 [Streptomyces sp. 8K308]